MNTPPLVKLYRMLESDQQQKQQQQRRSRRRHRHRHRHRHHHHHNSSNSSSNSNNNIIYQPHYKGNVLVETKSHMWNFRGGSIKHSLITTGLI